MKRRGSRTEERPTAAAAGQVSDDLDAMILLVDAEETPFAPITADEGLDLTRATRAGAWRCDWLELASEHA